MVKERKNIHTNQAGKIYGIIKKIIFVYEKKKKLSMNEYIQFT